MNDIELALFTIGDLEVTRRKLTEQLAELQAKLDELSSPSVDPESA